MRNFIKKITHPFLRVATKIWFYKPRKYSYKGINVVVHPKVFPPHYTISTKILLDFVDGLDINKKSLLELGCGSGIISLYTASKGAEVTAIDINKKALEYLKKASKKNKIPITVLHSNLFSKLDDQQFDFIIINPPYYPKNPKNQKEQAWFCGSDFEYFKELFSQLSKREYKETIYMILSQDCQLAIIESIAKSYNYNFTIVLKKTVLKELNFIYKVAQHNI